MTPIVLDAILANQLSRVGQPVSLSDPSGKVIGRFVPVLDMSEWEPVEPEPTEEELDAIERSIERTYSTAEVLAHLEKLP